MLGKLLKYEIKATSRTFLPLYGALLLVALINSVFSYNQSDFGFGITTMVLVGLFIALGVITLVVLIQRFNVNLLGDEGYLMFTLPVKAHQLILSKLITTLFWSLLSCIVAVLTFILLVFGLNFSFLKEFFTEFNAIWKSFLGIIQNEAFQQSILMLLLILALGLSTYISSILEIYLALSIGQLPMFCKHRNVSSFIAFFAINLGLQFLTFGFIMLVALFFPLNQSFFYQPIVALFLYLVFFMIIDVLFFFVIQTILNKHLNLE